MHHLVYPSQDAYVSNKLSEKSKNFGLDEMLIIGVSQSYSRVQYDTKTYHFGNEYVAGLPVENFTGKFTGSAHLYSSISSGTIVGEYNSFVAGYFSGSLTGSVSGYETGSSFTSLDFSGSLGGFSGQIVANSIEGWVSGSLVTTCFSRFTGTLTNATGSLTGYLTGDEIIDVQNINSAAVKYINRSFLKFDLGFISQSIVSGDITNPTYVLKLKVTEARELPVAYTIHAFPISQSWDQGDGYFSDGGSNDGASWKWRDHNSGSWWFSEYTNSATTESLDYLNHYEYVSESFKRGGGTWYNIPCTQSFGYETADINMDVTPIVNAWLNNTIPNEGFILMLSDEVNVSASNAHMFYFSQNTNTIFMPKLDVAWDDSMWVTGSFGTGSVEIKSYTPRLSGSIVDPVSVTGVYVTGSFTGDSFIVLGSSGEVLPGSALNVIGTSGSIKGLNINGSIVGTSSFADANGIRTLDVSFNVGDFVGCQAIAQYSGSDVQGMLSGSWASGFFIGHYITGSLPEESITLTFAYQNTPAPGNLIGNVSAGTDQGGIYQGIVTDGLLKDGIVAIPFTGSYSYVTASFSITSSVQITSSVIQPLNTNTPFVVILQDLKKSYAFGDIPRINLLARERFPLKTFGKAPQQPSYTTPRLLPTSSFYSIKDNETEEIIVDFDNYTKISCDPGGHYFYLDTTGLEKERYYKILIRVDCENGNSYTFDAIDLFKIRR